MNNYYSRIYISILEIKFGYPNTIQDYMRITQYLLQFCYPHMSNMCSDNYLFLPARYALLLHGPGPGGPGQIAARWTAGHREFLKTRGNAACGIWRAPLDLVHVMLRPTSTHAFRISRAIDLFQIGVNIWLDRIHQLHDRPVPPQTDMHKCDVHCFFPYVCVH